MRSLARGLMLRHLADRGGADPRVALSAMGAQLKASGLKAQVAGHVSAAGLAVEITVGSDGLADLKADLVEALRPYPAAAAAVVRVLESRRGAA